MASAHRGCDIRISRHRGTPDNLREGIVRQARRCHSPSETRLGLWETSSGEIRGVGLLGVTITTGGWVPGCRVGESPASTCRPLPSAPAEMGKPSSRPRSGPVPGEAMVVAHGSSSEDFWNTWNTWEASGRILRFFSCKAVRGVVDIRQFASVSRAFLDRLSPMDRKRSRRNKGMKKEKSG